jgi:hypothetical protein
MFLLLFCTALTVVAQDEEQEKGFKKENLFAGGSFNLSIGNYTFINISPQLGYQFNRYFAAGMGINAQYQSNKVEINNSDSYRTSRGVVGLSIFGRAFPVRFPDASGSAGI